MTLEATQDIITDSQKYIEERVVSKEGENDEVKRVNHSRTVSTLWLNALIHNLIPILAGQHLKNGQEGDGKGVEIRGGSPVREVECTAKELHAQQGKDQDKQK